jgi:hypothetical protein
MARNFVAIFAVVLGLAACVTPSADDKESAKRTHYTLKLGKKTAYHPPLPTRTDIEVTWHYSNGATETLSGYRGWDFDGDDRFEMIEVLAKDGAVQSRVYDFDGAGEIDRTR